MNNVRCAKLQPCDAKSSWKEEDKRSPQRSKLQGMMRVLCFTAASLRQSLTKIFKTNKQKLWYVAPMAGAQQPAFTILFLHPSSNALTMLWIAL